MVVKTITSKIKRPHLVVGLFECLVSDESIPRKTQKVFKRWKDHGRRGVPNRGDFVHRFRVNDLPSLGRFD